MSRPWGASHGVICSVMRWRGQLEGLDCEAVIQEVLAKLWARSQLKHRRWKRINYCNMGGKKEGNKSQKSLRHWKVIMKKCWRVRDRKGEQAELFFFKSWLIISHYGKYFSNIRKETLPDAYQDCTQDEGYLYRQDLRQMDLLVCSCLHTMGKREGCPDSWIMEIYQRSDISQQRDIIKNINIFLLF